MKRSIIYLISGFLIVLCSALIISSSLEVDTTHVDVQRGRGDSIKGTLYTPKGKVAAGVVLVHGVVVNKEYMATMAKTMAAHQIAALTFDLGGAGESYRRSSSAEDNVKDVRSAVNFLRNQFPEIGDKAVGVIGHSMGGVAAVRAAIEDQNIEYTACVGTRAEIPSKEHGHFLFATGLYDPLFTPSEMREIFSGNSASNSIDGDFIKVLVSPTANHQTEMADAQIVKGVGSWMASGLLGKEVRSNHLAIVHKHLHTCLTLGIFMPLCLGLARFRNKRLVATTLLVMGAVVTVFSGVGLISPLVSSTVVMVLLGLVVIAGFWTPPKHDSLMRVLILALGLVVVIDLVNVLNSMGEYMRSPVAMLHIPKYLIQSFVTLLPTGLGTFRPHLFVEYTSTLIPSWPLMVVIFMELGWPGCLLRFVTSKVDKIIGRCQSRISLSLYVSKKQLLLLLGVVLLFAVLVVQSVSGGFINQETLQVLGGLIAKRILPTVLMMTVLIRILVKAAWFPSIAKRHHSLKIDKTSKVVKETERL